MYPINHDITRAVSPMIGEVKQLLSRWVGVAVAFLFMATGAFAQHDVALEKTVDRDSVAAGDIVTFTVRVSNQNMTNVAGLQVRDTLLPGLTYISHIAPTGTTYDISNGIWNINSQLNANTPELILTIKTRVEWEGMYMNIAEVTAMEGTDVDSEPNNDELLEDDMDKACVSIPITICTELNDSVRVTLLPMFTNIQWYKDGVLIPANQGGIQDTFYITSAGIFAFTATQNGCPTLTCCPVVVKDSCYDLALRKTLAIGQNGTVTVGSLVDFNLEIFNQGDLAAHSFSIIDQVDPNFFAPFNLSNNPPGTTSGDATIPYTWSSVGQNGKVTLNGKLSPGESVQLPVTLKVVHGGLATNFAEIDTDDDRDVDSQPESKEQNGNADQYVDNEINNANGDEDDHDGASLTILASSLGDFVWNDLDHNGQQDPGEPGIPGIIVHLYDANNNLLAADTTDTNGAYFFDDLPPGDYYLVFQLSTLPAEHEPTLSNTGDDASDSDADDTGTTNVVTLGAGETNNTLDFGVELGLFDLALLKATTTTDVMLGDTVTYTITVYNQGQVTAHNVTVMDYLPNGLLFNAALNPMWSTAPNGYSTQLPGTIPPGGTAAVNILLIVDPAHNGNTILNTAEISFADNDNNPGNGSPQDGDSTPDDDAVNDGIGSGQEDDIDEAPVHVIPAGEFDLSLEKMLTPGQPSLVDIGDEVSYTIKITNEGTLPAYHIDVNDNIPAGLALSPNDPNWTMSGTGMATYVFPGPLQPGQSALIEILMVVLYGASGQQIVNTAEIASAEDDDGTVYTDLDSTPNNGNPDEDDIDGETIELLPHDPTGWIYCDKTGRIIPGGRITVVGPNGIPNSQVNIIHDGSEGYYEFYTDGTPGIYTLSYLHPNGFPLSPNCPAMPGPFDPTGMANPVILGSDTLNADYIEDKTCGGNPYYLTFRLAPGDPIILHNNLPVQCILIASIACEDTNNNDMADSGDQPLAGATVHLYDCANPNVPIMTSITDAEGHYRFDGLEPGSYRVGYQLTPGIRPVANGMIDANGFSPCITLDWGQCDTNTVICLYTCPDVSAGPDLAHCNNTQSSQLYASVPYGNGTFTWSPTNGLSNPNIRNPVATPAASTTYTVTFSDGRGCVDSDAMTISIGNPTPILSFTPWADTTIDCTSPLHPWQPPTFADGCDNNLTITQDSTVANNPCGRTIVRTWTATNDNGNSISFTQTVTVEDHTPPVMFANHAFFGQIQHGDTLYADCTQIPSLDSLGFSAYDFCSATTHNFTENVTHGTCALNGFLQSRYCGWTATDACGNTDSLYFWVIISDDEAPVLAGVPANLTLACGQTAPPVASVTATDNCSAAPTISFNQTQSGNGCNSVITRTWTATDACGNIATATQTIQLVIDNQPPVLVNIPANTSGTCGNIPPIPSNVSATDNCDTQVDIVFNEILAGNNCNYTRTRTWTATDDCGLTTVRTQVITLTDDDSPVLVGVPTYTTASCGYVPAPPVVTATDGCDTNVAVTFSETQTGIGCSYTLTRRWTATDDCNHVTTATQVINVVDDRGPEIRVTAPALTWLSHGDTIIRQCNQVFSLNGSNATAVDSCCSVPPTMVFHEFVKAGNCATDGYIQLMNCGWVATDCCGNVDSLFFTVIVTDTIPPKLYGVPDNVVLPCGQTTLPAIPTVVAQDPCTNNIPVIFTTNTVNFPGGYILTRTWSATDGCGNTGTISQNITVTQTDLVPPVLASVPANLSLDCGAAIPPPPPAWGAGSVTATDFCDATPTISFYETIGGNMGCQIITRTWTATDNAGNTSTATQTITVTDGVAPVLVGVPANATVDCGSIPAPANVTATDNCDASVTVTYNQMQTGSGCSYTLTRTWTATDDCGNLASAQQIINVNDAIRPVFAGVLPQNLSVECTTAIPAPTTLTATDNCDANVAVTFAETQNGSGCSYTLTRTWTATDDCGNSTIAQQVITVNDSQAPTFVGGLPQNLTVDCASIPTPATLTATDNCDANVAVTFAETPSGTGCNRTLTRTWTATDDCGNSTVAQQILTIMDNAPPVLYAVHAFFGEIRHGDTLYADCSQMPSLDSIGFSATDACGETTRTFTENVVQGNCQTDGFLERRYCGWTASDACGNTDSLFFTVFISDTLAPTLLNVPGFATAECGQVPPSTVTAIDNCGQAVPVSLQESINGTGSTGVNCNRTLTRTWTATDACGNSVTASQTIALSDTQSPVFVETLPQNMVLQCLDNIPAPATLTATDGCEGSLAVVFQQNQTGTGCDYTLTRTWTATDACGNAVSHVQTITVSDTATLGIEFADPQLAGMNSGDTLLLPCDEPALFDMSDAFALGGCSQATIVFTESGVQPGNCFASQLGGDGFINIAHCTWTATDSCGNTATITLHIATVDHEPPVFSNVPQDVTIGCNEPLPPCGEPTVTDNCGEVIMSQNTTTVPTVGGYDRICTWRATDGCGNSSIATRTIHVVGNAAPFISEAPADTVIYLANGGTIPPAANVTASEGCPAVALPVTYNETVQQLGTEGCVTRLTRSWMATTSTGSHLLQEQRITVIGSNNATVAAIVADTCSSGLGAITLAPPSYAYSWSNGATGFSLNALDAGTYTVTATNGTCQKVVNIMVPNIQVPLTITAINTTPQACNTLNGTASIAPATHTYQWSDGGTGANRTGLAAGSYNVTATVGPAGPGTCETVFVVNIENGCECEPAVLTSINKTDAGCGQANGAATLNITNVSSYGFLWTPDLGISNGFGNARTGLPAGHYVVLATYQGNNGCVEKFEFDIFDDCPKCAPVFPMESMTVEVTSAPARVCLPVPLSVATQMELRVDGQLYGLKPQACDPELVAIYGFAPMPTGLLQVSWQVGSDTFHTLTNSLANVTNFMNHLDADGNWHFDANKRLFVTNNTKVGSYGKLQVTSLETGATYSSLLKQSKASLGTSIRLAEGQHLVTLNSPLTGCADSLLVNLVMNSIAVADPTELETNDSLKPDQLRTRKGEAVKGDVLSNDQLNRAAKQLRIAQQPANGTAWVNVNNTVSYRPLVEYCNSYEGGTPDVFTYEICFDDGSKLQTTVTVEVECPKDEASPKQDIVLYPNPANRYAFLDVSALAGQPLKVQVYNNLGVVVRQLNLPEATTEPVRIELDGLSTGHYAVWIRPAEGKAFVRQLIVGN